MNRKSIGLKREVTLRGRNTIIHYVTKTCNNIASNVSIHIIRGQSLLL